jgi:hypothetical protein
MTRHAGTHGSLPCGQQLGKVVGLAQVQEPKPADLCMYQHRTKEETWGFDGLLAARCLPLRDHTHPGAPHDEHWSPPVEPVSHCPAWPPCT